MYKLNKLVFRTGLINRTIIAQKNIETCIELFNYEKEMSLIDEIDESPNQNCTNF